MRSSWFQMGPTSDDECPYKGQEGRDTALGRRPCEMEARTGVVPPQTKEAEGPPQPPDAREEAGGDSPSGPSRQPKWCFWPPKPQESEFCFLEPPWCGALLQLPLDVNTPGGAHLGAGTLPPEWAWPRAAPGASDPHQTGGNQPAHILPEFLSRISSGRDRAGGWVKAVMTDLSSHY